jgi:hypothetical protein
MKAIFTFVILLLIVSAAVSSAILYLNETYFLSAVLCIISIVSLSLWIKSADMHVIDTEKA